MIKVSTSPMVEKSEFCCLIGCSGVSVLIPEAIFIDEWRPAVRTQGANQTGYNI
jgi:hypothetical protein